jgi:HK97 family phage major capsid protein
MKTSLKIMKFLLGLLVMAVVFGAFLTPVLGISAIMLAAPLLLANIETSDDAKAKRSKIYDKMEELLNLRKTEKRKFSEEEQTQYDQLKTDFDTLTGHIKELEDDEKRALIMAGNQARQSNKEKEEREVGKYSVKRMLEFAMNGKTPDGLEGEMHEEAQLEARNANVGISGIGIPNYVIGLIAKRAMSATQQTSAVGDQGGMLVPIEKSGLLFALRPLLVMNQLGANFMGGLVGNLDFVRGSSTVAAWGTEIHTAAETNVITSKITMAPNRLAAFTEIYKQLMVQTPENIEQKVIGDILRAVAQEVERAAINGSGNTNQPRGILNTSGIGSTVGGTDGLAPTWAHIVDLETKVDIANALMGNLAYLTNAKVKGLLKTTKLDDGSGLFVWPQNGSELNGYKVAVSNLVPSTLTKGSGTGVGVCSAIVFGDWSELMIGQWGGLDLIVDPYSGAKNNKIIITTNSFWDVATTWPEKFAAMLDARTS